MAASHESERFSGSDTELRLPSQWSTAQGISNEEEGSPAEEPMRACSQASVLTAQWAPNPSDHIIHRIASWDGALNLHTIAMSLDNGMVQVHHYAQVTVIIPEQDITAKQISLPMVLRNGPKSQPTMNLKPGQNTLSFVDDVPVSCGQEADIAIIRDVQDLKAPLHLYFSSTYTLKERHIAVPIPSLRPQTGKLRSESIYIAVSYPPLTTKPFTRQEFSTWKLGCDTTSQVTHYERTPLLRLYPERFSDDLRVHITDPDPVSFRSLEDLHPSDVIWDFNMSVERQLGIDFSCRMSLVLHVGEANRLLNVDSHGWIPEYSIINGRLATHEWRKGNGATLFKQPGMINGPLKVDFVWHKPRNCGGFIFALPRVMDLKILPGKMTCKIDRLLVILDHVGAAERTHDFIDGPDTQLPALHPGYQMYLKSFSEGPQPALPIVSEMEDPIECITPSSSKIENVACDEVSERTSDVKEGVDRHQKDELYWSAALVICVFMLGWAMIYSIWLVPLLDCSVKSYLSERNYPIVDVAAAVATPMELASAAVVYQQDNREEVPALRDWVDCLLGWTGDVCRRE